MAFSKVLVSIVSRSISSKSHHGCSKILVDYYTCPKKKNTTLNTNLPNHPKKIFFCNINVYTTERKIKVFKSSKISYLVTFRKFAACHICHCQKYCERKRVRLKKCQIITPFFQKKKKPTMK